MRKALMLLMPLEWREALAVQLVSFSLCERVRSIQGIPIYNVLETMMSAAHSH